MARVCVRDWQVDRTSKAQRQDACRSLAVVYRLSAICRPLRTPGYVASSSTFAALVASARRCRSERNKGARTQQRCKKSLFLHVPALFNTQPNCTSVNASKAHKGLANRPFSVGAGAEWQCRHSISPSCSRSRRRIRLRDCRTLAAETSSSLATRSVGDPSTAVRQKASHERGSNST